MSDSTMTPIGHLLETTIYETFTPEGKGFLKGHPGRGRTVLEYGMERIMRHPIVSASNELDVRGAVEALYAKSERLCESPIERNLLAALITGCWSFSKSALPLVLDVKDDENDIPRSDVLIVPQLAVSRYRLDFAVVIEKGGSRHIFGLECDGAEFHQDAGKDRRRDAQLWALGIIVLHFSGSELFRSPIATADGIISAITEWRDKE